MSATYSYPGIYLTEGADIPRTVTPATTSMTAILGMYARGPVDQAVLVTSLSEFNAQFGGDTIEGLATYAVMQFFANGGTGAWIVRLSAIDSRSGTAGLEGLTITANSPGAWSSTYAVSFEVSKVPGNLDATVSPPAPKLVDFVVTQGLGGGGSPPGPPPPELERIPRLPTNDLGKLAALISNASQYVTAAIDTTVTNPAPVAAASPRFLDGGNDGTWNATTFLEAVKMQIGDAPTPAQPPADTGAAGAPAPTVHGPLLDLIAPQVFNILCIPDLVWVEPGDQTVAIEAAHQYAAAHHAFLLVDPPPPEEALSAAPSWSDTTTTVDRVGIVPTEMEALVSGWGEPILRKGMNSGAVYYPWLVIPDPLQAGAQVYVPPSGTIAGVYAATDAARGVWKAPAGVDAALNGVIGLADTTIDDTANGQMNVLGVNALRTFPVYSTVVWGSRTLSGGDLLDDPWKYVPVRRLTDYIEQTLLQSLKWAIFEPNAPALWASISLEVGSFMSSLYAAGAFFGATAAQAFQVVCDQTTTSPADLLNGIVRVIVGFQPVEPAEFVVLNIKLNAGAAAS